METKFEVHYMTEFGGVKTIIKIDDLVRFIKNHRVLSIKLAE